MRQAAVRLGDTQEALGIGTQHRDRRPQCRQQRGRELTQPERVRGVVGPDRDADRDRDGSHRFELGRGDFGGKPAG